MVLLEYLCWIHILGLFLVHDQWLVLPLTQVTEIAFSKDVLTKFSLKTFYIHNNSFNLPRPCIYLKL